MHLGREVVRGQGRWVRHGRVSFLRSVRDAVGARSNPTNTRAHIRIWEVPPGRLGEHGAGGGRQALGAGRNARARRVRLSAQPPEFIAELPPEEKARLEAERRAAG